MQSDSHWTFTFRDKEVTSVTGKILAGIALVILVAASFTLAWYVVINFWHTVPLILILLIALDIALKSVGSYGFSHCRRTFGEDELDYTFSFSIATDKGYRQLIGLTLNKDAFKRTVS